VLVRLQNVNPERNTSKMSLDYSALNDKIEATDLPEGVSIFHPVIQAANAVPWKKLAKIIEPDLKATTKKGFIKEGRKQSLRKYLGILILQTMFKLTDKQMEEQLKHNNLYKSFCGADLLEKFQVPDASNIGKLRNRISPSSHMHINEAIIQEAIELKLINGEFVDIDSTVQGLNMRYPTDISLVMELVKKADRLNREFNLGHDIPLKKLEEMARRYYFLAKNTVKKKRRKLFQDIVKLAKRTVALVVEWAEKNMESINTS
jgi:hypothetical protein